MNLSLMNRLCLCLSSVRITHMAQVYLVVGNAFSSQEAVSPIKAIICNDDPVMCFEMCLRAEPHLYVSLAAASKCHLY
jgi:hypothetical protein